jgi:hypothetical protein
MLHCKNNETSSISIYSSNGMERKIKRFFKNNFYLCGFNFRLGQFFTVYNHSKSSTSGECNSIIIFGFFFKSFYKYRYLFLSILRGFCKYLKRLSTKMRSLKYSCSQTCASCGLLQIRTIFFCFYLFSQRVVLRLS